MRSRQGPAGHGSAPQPLGQIAGLAGSELGGALDLDWSDDAAEGQLFVSLSGYDGNPLE